MAPLPTALPPHLRKQHFLLLFEIMWTVFLILMRENFGPEEFKWAHVLIAAAVLMLMLNLVLLPIMTFFPLAWSKKLESESLRVQMYFVACFTSQHLWTWLFPTQNLSSQQSWRSLELTHHYPESPASFLQVRLIKFFEDSYKPVREDCKLGRGRQEDGAAYTSKH